MTLPSALQSEGYTRTISEVREALERRITNQTNRLPITPNYHRGRPNLNALPDEQCSVWLDWDSVDKDEEGSAHLAPCFKSVWRIFIVTRDEEDDAFGSHSSLGEAVWGAILGSFTEQLYDTSLDGAIEYFVDPSTQHVRGMGPDRRLESFELALSCLHAPSLILRPPPP